MSPRHNSPSPREVPTNRMRSMPPPHAVEILSRPCTKPIRACAAAMRKSQATDSSAPPPIASPLSAAITGSGNARIVSSDAFASRAISAAPSSVVIDASSRKSPPAAKHCSPAPRKTATRKLRSSRLEAKASASERKTSPLNALRLSGRLMVTRSTPPLDSTIMSEAFEVTSSLPGGGAELDERRSMIDSLPNLHAHAFDHGRTLGAQSRLGLHRFQHDERVVSCHLRTFLHQDLEYGPRHRRIYG